jgi:hypothetical protein
MFFGSRKRHQTASRALHPSDLGADVMEGRQSPQWHTWKRSAQTVTRTWHEWLAANGRERTELYRRYLCALAEEERAATELERAINLGAVHRRA